MARLRKERKKQDFLVPELTLTPLIDTVLVLLVVFMMTTPLLHNSITVELPSSANNDDPQVAENQNIQVTIDKQRNLFIDEIPVAKEQFFKELEKKVGPSTNAVVSVYADLSIPYGVVVNIVDDIKYIGGIKYVALATERA